ncbi:MAG: hypothetical protein ACFB4I_16270 [Cyanophyceae cyanobacterium]
MDDLTTNPNNYDFFTFRPNLKKLILAGAAETEHISILWYTVLNGSIERHYHAMTKSVYTNSPGSGHEISESTGFFILAYASPPDFANTNLIEEYNPVHIDTTAPNLD